MKREGEGTPDGGRPTNLFYQGGRVRTRSLLIEDSKKNSGYHLFTASLADHGFVDVFHGLVLFPCSTHVGMKFYMKFHSNSAVTGKQGG